MLAGPAWGEHRRGEGCAVPRGLCRGARLRKLSKRWHNKQSKPANARKLCTSARAKMRPSQGGGVRRGWLLLPTPKAGRRPSRLYLGSRAVLQQLRRDFGPSIPRLCAFAARVDQKTAGRRGAKRNKRNSTCSASMSKFPLRCRNFRFEAGEAEQTEFRLFRFDLEISASMRVKRAMSNSTSPASI